MWVPAWRGEPCQKRLHAVQKAPRLHFAPAGVVIAGCRLQAPATARRGPRAPEQKSDRIGPRYLLRYEPSTRADGGLRS